MAAKQPHETDDRRRAVVARVTGSASLMAQHRASQSSHERGDPRIPGEQVRGEAKARRRRSASTRVEQIVEQLQGSLNGLTLAVSLVPEAWHHRLPRELPGFEDDAWSVAMNLAHLALYEETLAAPVVESLATGGDGASVLDPAILGRVENETVRLAAESMPEILERLRAVRERQIVAARALSDEDFSRPLTTVWRMLAENPAVPVRSAGWVLTKTVQHTWEHGNAVLRIALRVAP